MLWIHSPSTTILHCPPILEIIFITNYGTKTENPIKIAAIVIGSQNLYSHCALKPLQPATSDHRRFCFHLNGWHIGKIGIFFNWGWHYQFYAHCMPKIGSFLLISFKRWQCNILGKHLGHQFCGQRRVALGHRGG